MICNTLIASCLVLYSAFVPVCRANPLISSVWQKPRPVAEVAGIATQAAVKPTPAPAPKYWDPMVGLINRERVTNGLSELTENAKLDASAKAKACDMLNRNYWSHDGPDGKSTWHFFTDNGYNYSYAGENLAKDFSSDVDAMARLMTSETHRANILGTHYKEVGIGRCGQYIVQHYARR